MNESQPENSIDKTHLIESNAVNKENQQIEATQGSKAVDKPRAGHLFTSETAPRNGGRPKGSINWRHRFEQELAAVEKRKRKQVFTKYAEEAYRDNKILDSLVDRILPRLKADQENEAPQVVVNIVNYVVNT